MNIFYRSKRIGKYGKLFTLYKFRTMVDGADKYGDTTALNDKRLTKIGKFLRKWQIDELPQLINVLKGDMGIVGPRPDTIKEIENLSDDNREVILRMKPGLVSPAVLYFYPESRFLEEAGDDPLLAHKRYLQKMRPIKTLLDMEYVQQKNWRLDFDIILHTIWIILRK